MADENIPEVPLADVPIRVASGLDTTDEIHYLQTMGAVLQGFPQLRVADYWALTCAEHAALMRHLFPGGGDDADA